MAAYRAGRAEYPRVNAGLQATNRRFARQECGILVWLGLKRANCAGDSALDRTGNKTGRRANTRPGKNSNAPR